ncbi:MAG: zinc ABC transporter substrate-binding protein [Bacteroidetes bacterium]|nr:zinc ABC transporter substrate-binding protein [Bacteroidota bacterium]
MKKLIVILLSTLIYFACSEKKEEQSINETKLKRIASVNYPLHFFVTQIGGSKVDAIYPIPTDVDPAYWEPTAEDIILYQEADLILLNGAGYAKWVDKVSLPQSKMINTSLSFKDKYIDLEEGQTHSHGPEGEHEHKGFAFTTWLDFNNAIIQAEEVYKALSNLLPDSEETFKSNLQSLKNDIADLHKKMKAAAKKIEGTTLVASHPVYQYLSNGYNLKIISFHWEPDHLRDDMMWEGFEKILASSKATIMLWEDTPLIEVNDKLINLGVKPIVFNPCANTPASGDFLSIMKTNIVNLGDL